MSEAFFKQAVESEKKGKVDLAATLYERILENIPHHPATLYNLATLNAKRNDYSRAINLYERFFEVETDFVQAYYNAALCYMKKNDIARAIDLLETAVALSPQYAEAQHLLGGIYLRRDQFDKAHVHLHAAIQAKPDDANALCHLGMLCVHLSQLDEAIIYLNKAIAIDTSLAEAHYHLGLITLRRAQFDEAEHHFQSTIARDSAHFSAYYNLALIKKHQQQLQLARHYIERAHTVSPDHPFVSYLYATLSQQHIPNQTPTQLVESLFDHYAPHYDQHLTETLQCDLPEKCRKLMVEMGHLPPGGRWGVVADLGCGTGLSGLAFRDQVDQLIGTDLSQKMLDKAREKNIYHTLYHENMFDTLKRFDHAIDLAICCDTLVYVGDLEPFFEGLSLALRKEGCAVFTCETSEHAPFALSLDGRFTHHPDYIQSCTDKYGFTMIASEPTTLRDQAGEKVRGIIYFIQM